MSAGTEPLDDTFGYGVAASRPAAGIPGRVYYSSDTEVLERDNGTSWDPVASGGSLEVADEDDAPDVTGVTEIEFLFAGTTVPRYTACLAQRTTTLSYSVNPTAIPFDAADIYDPDGWHDPSSNPTRLTCPSGLGGRVFWVGGQTEWGGGGGPMLSIRKGGSEMCGSTQITNYLGTVAAPVYLADGEYVELIIGTSSNSLILTDGPTRFGVMG